MKKLLLFLFTLALGVGDLRAQTTEGIRLALVAPEASLRPALDLLTVELSRDDRISLLERTEIERIYREQAVSATGQDYLKLGRVLGADGLLVAETIKDGTSDQVAIRLLAVKPGVVLGALRSPWPVEELTEWVKGVPAHFAALIPKLTVLPKDAVPISVVNLRSAISSRETRELEQQLTLLTIERLTRERELFVLERQRMELLSDEHELKPAEDSAFWNGSYLLDGVIDRDGYAKERVTLHARVAPPTGSSTIELSVEGRRTNIVEVVEQLTLRLLAALKRDGAPAAWKPEAEAQRYFGEAKWAMRWNMAREAQSAADSAWALGLHNPEVAEVRVRAWRETGLNRELCYIDPDKGWVTYSAPPDASQFADLLQAARIYESGWFAFKVGDAKLDRRWFELACALVEDLSNWLRHYYFVVEARAEAEDKIAEGRRLVTTIFSALTQHPDYKLSDQGRLLLGIAAHGAAFWWETPAQGLAFHRKLVDSGEWQWVRPRFITVGRFPSENRTSGALGASPYADPASPPLAGWKWGDRQKAAALWQGYVDELCASSNGVLQLEGRILRCSFAWTGDEYERELSQVLKFALSQTNEIFRAKLQTNLFTHLKLLAGIERLGGTPFLILRSDRLTRERLSRIKQKLWQPFEKEFTGLMASAARHEASAAKRDEFERVKDLFSSGKPIRIEDYANLHSWPYEPAQAEQLLPLVSQYRQRFASSNRFPGAASLTNLEARLRARIKGAETNRIPAQLVQRTNVNQLPAIRPMTSSRPPGIVAGVPARPATGAVSNQLRADKFWSLQRAGWEIGKAQDFVVWDVVYREGQLWAQVNFVEQERGTGQREEQCVVAAIEPDSMNTRLISLREQIPSHEGAGIFKVRIESRIFEVIGDELIITTGEGLKKLSLREDKWTTLAAPVSGKLRLQRLGQRLFVLGDESILELGTDVTGVKVLASTRRRPAATILDEKGYFREFHVLSLGMNDVRLFHRGALYTLGEGGDWTLNGVPEAVRSWLTQVLGPKPTTGDWSGLDVFKPGTVSASQNPANTGWRPPSPGGHPGSQGPFSLCGENLWMFSGGIEFVAGQGVAEMSRNSSREAHLLGFSASTNGSRPVRLQLQMLPEKLNPYALTQLTRPHSPEAIAVAGTERGLALFARHLPGFWFIPRTELDNQLAPP